MPLHSSGLYNRPAEGLLVLNRCLLIANRGLFVWSPSRAASASTVPNCSNMCMKQSPESSRSMVSTPRLFGAWVCVWTWVFVDSPLQTTWPAVGLFFRDPNICFSERCLNNKHTVGQPRFCAGASVIFVHAPDDVQLYLFVSARFVSAHMHQFF